VLLAIVSTLSACGSDSKATTTIASAQTESTDAAATDASTSVTSAGIASTTVEVETTSAPPLTVVATSTAVPVELAAVCPLVTPELVTRVLGAASTDNGTERIFEPTYKNCRWLTDSGAGNSNALEVAVLIRKSPSAQGFSPSNNVGEPVPIEGVGDAATYSSTGQTGSEIAQLIAGEGLISVSITVNYGGTPHTDDVQGALAEIARQVFGQLNG
jgi:hypothetical protein